MSILLIFSSYIFSICDRDAEKETAIKRKRNTIKSCLRSSQSGVNCSDLYSSITTHISV